MDRQFLTLGRTRRGVVPACVLLLGCLFMPAAGRAQPILKAPADGVEPNSANEVESPPAASPPAASPPAASPSEDEPSSGEDPADEPADESRSTKDDQSEATTKSEVATKGEAPPTEPSEDARRTENEQTLTDASVLTEAESPGEQDRRKVEEPSTRWSEVGAFVGMVSRKSSSDRFQYRPGIAYGGFFRPQITDFLAVRISYREERIPVDAQPGAYDYDGYTHDLDLQQPDLKVTNLGLRIEPSYRLLPHLHLIGMLSWSWTRYVAPMPEAEGFYQRADRAAVELNWGLGGGVSLDLLKNWLSLSTIVGYHFVTNQTGFAIEESTQAIVDGQMTYFAPLARPKNMVDVLFSVGLIL